MSQQSNEPKKKETKPLFAAFNPSGEKSTPSEATPSFGSFPSMFTASNGERSAELTEQQRKFTGSAFSTSSTSAGGLENTVGPTFGASPFSLEGFGKTSSAVPGLTAAAVKKSQPKDASSSGLSSAFNASPAATADKKNTIGATPSLFPTFQSGRIPENESKKDALQASSFTPSASPFGSFGDLKSGSNTGKSSFLFTKSDTSAPSGALAAQQELAQKSSLSSLSAKPFSGPTGFGVSPFGGNTSLNTSSHPSSSAFGGFSTAATDKNNSQKLNIFGGFNTSTFRNKDPLQTPSQSSSQPLQSAFQDPNTSASRLGSTGKKKSVSFSVPLVTDKREIPILAPSPVTPENTTASAGMLNFPIQKKPDTDTTSNSDPSKLTSSPFTSGQPAAQTNKEESSPISSCDFTAQKTLDTSSPPRFTFGRVATTAATIESTAARIEPTFQKSSDTSATSGSKIPSPFTLEKPKSTTTADFSFTKPPETASMPFFTTSTKTSTDQTPPSFALKPTISQASSSSTTETTNIVLSTCAPLLFGNTSASTSSIAVPSNLNGSTQNAPPTHLPFPTLNFKDKNLFSFKTIIDDLIKDLNISAHQLQPLLLGTMQRYETIATPFRIDNITKNSQFNDLPQEAQTILMQFESHIYGESQRSESISRRLEAMQGDLEQTKVDRVAKQVEIVHHRLKIQCHEVRKVIEATQYQLGHANAGVQNILSTNYSHRWLFGYARNDDYFVRLSLELSERLEEYKKCIWEVERMAESLQQVTPYSSHNIGAIIDAQNNVFIGLANKVVALNQIVETLQRS